MNFFLIYKWNGYLCGRKIVYEQLYDDRLRDGRPEMTTMKRNLLYAAALLASVLAPISCERENTEYGKERPPVETTEGTLSLTAMRIALATETETIDAVVRPEAATAAGNVAVGLRSPHTTRPAESYACRIADAAGTVVAEFAYDRRPETLTLPAGAYTLMVDTSVPQAAAWDAPAYSGRQELLVDKGSPAEVGDVLCTPAAVGVSLAFDDAFDANSTVTVDCGDRALVFTPAERRTAYFTVGEARTLNLGVEGRTVEGSPIAFTRRFTDVQPGQWYRFDIRSRALAAPAIEWLDHDIKQRYRAVEGLDARIHIAAPAGIRSFIVRIVSEKVLTPEVLESVGLRSEFDLTQPADLQEMLEMLGFPTGDAVADRTEVSFDITQFMGLIPLLGNGDSDFVLTVTDNEGQTATEAVMVYSSDEEEPTPEGPEQEYPGGEAKPLGSARPIE